jgi:hypothetical protein
MIENNAIRRRRVECDENLVVHVTALLFEAHYTNLRLATGHRVQSRYVATIPTANAAGLGLGTR